MIELIRSLFVRRTHLSMVQQDLDQSRVHLLEWQSSEETARSQVSMYRARIIRLEAYLAAENAKKNEAVAAAAAAAAAE